MIYIGLTKQGLKLMLVFIDSKNQRRRFWNTPLTQRTKCIVSFYYPNKTTFKIDDHIYCLVESDTLV